MNQTEIPFSFRENKKYGNAFLHALVNIFFLFLFFPFATEAQKIKRSEYDAANKIWRIESVPVNLKTAVGVKLNATLRWAGTAGSIWLSGSGMGANTVIRDDKAIFLLDNDSTVTVKSPSVQNVARNGGPYNHEYLLSPDDLDSLSRHPVLAIRKYSAEGYNDIYLDKEAALNFKELNAAFLAELKKTAVLPSQKSSSMPAFPGGKQVLLRFLNRNLNAPLLLNGAERRYAVVEFRVAADGSISDFQLKHPAGDAFDKELMRILKRMPNWKPASQNGKAVDAFVTQPLTFLRTEGRMKIMF